jgi:hypothetical protein
LAVSVWRFGEPFMLCSGFWSVHGVIVSLWAHFTLRSSSASMGGASL